MSRTNLNRYFVLLITIFFVGCTMDKPQQVQEQKATLKTSEEMAREDFDAIKAGKDPLNAMHDKSKPDLADGGTTFYKGQGYTLTLQMKLSEKEKAKGYLYGPIITFDEPMKAELSDIRFYTVDELRKLRGK